MAAAAAAADYSWSATGWLPSHNRPSKTPFVRGPWIGAHSPRGAGLVPDAAAAAAVAEAAEERAVAADLLAIFRKGLVEEDSAGGPRRRGLVREETVAAMRDRIARARGGVNTRGGKWVAFARGEHADAVWALVARLVEAGALGPAAKIATADPPPAPSGHVIIIYTADMYDAADVRRVLDVLVAAGIAKAAGAGRVIGYKPGAFTLMEALMDDAEKRAWDSSGWRGWRTVYQSDRPAGAGLARGKLPLPGGPPGGVEAAAAAVAAARAAVAGGVQRAAAAEEVIVLSSSDDDDDDQGARGAPRQRVG